MDDREQPYSETTSPRQNEANLDVQPLIIKPEDADDIDCLVPTPCKFQEVVEEVDNEMKWSQLKQMMCDTDSGKINTVHVEEVGQRHWKIQNIDVICENRYDRAISVESVRSGSSQLSLGTSYSLLHTEGLTKNDTLQGQKVMEPHTKKLYSHSRRKPVVVLNRLEWNGNLTQTWKVTNRHVSDTKKTACTFNIQEEEDHELKWSQLKKMVCENKDVEKNIPNIEEASQVQRQYGKGDDDEDDDGFDEDVDGAVYPSHQWNIRNTKDIYIDRDGSQSLESVKPSSSQQGIDVSDSPISTLGLSQNKAHQEKQELQTEQELCSDPQPNFAERRRLLVVLDRLDWNGEKSQTWNVSNGNVIRTVEAASPQNTFTSSSVCTIRPHSRAKKYDDDCHDFDGVSQGLVGNEVSSSGSDVPGEKTKRNSKTDKTFVVNKNGGEKSVILQPSSDLVEWDKMCELIKLEIRMKDKAKNLKIFKCGLCGVEFQKRHFILSHSKIHINPHNLTASPFAFNHNLVSINVHKPARIKQEPEEKTEDSQPLSVIREKIRMKNSKQIAKKHKKAWKRANKKKISESKNTKPKKQYLEHQSLEGESYHQTCYRLYIKRPCKCALCNAVLSSKPALQYHMKIHSGEKPYSCVVCEKKFRNAACLRTHKRTHTGVKPYKCSLCSREFSHSGGLSHHLRVHAGVKPYVCSVCNKAFSSASHLNGHMRVHTGEMPYSCETCGKLFKFRSVLKDHFRIHTGERPYACKVCGKTFRKYSHLDVHIKIHSEEKPYQCDQCPARFKRSHHLSSHMANHSDKKLFECNICGHTFKRQRNLDSHKQVHEGDNILTCSDCGVKFRHKISLNRHIMECHNGLKTGHCYACDQEFNSARQLKKHMLSKHKGLKPYKCNICSKSFNRTENISHHYKVFHPEVDNRNITSKHLKPNKYKNPAENGECDN